MKKEELLTRNELLKAEIERLNGIIDCRNGTIANYQLREYKYRSAKKELEYLKCLIKEQQDVIKFLTTSKFADDHMIELAAIKTYRGGWQVLMHNGVEVPTTTETDITIYATPHEAVSISTSN